MKTVEGWFYGPEGHNYGSFGPMYITQQNSYITLSANKKKIEGVGYKFFYSQLITGDTVDNILGLRGKGPAAAVKILDGCNSEPECYLAVRGAYREVLMNADECLLEMAYLLHMVRGYNEDGSIMMWESPMELL